MIRGKVNRNREAIIELDIVGSNLHEKIEAIIDTGYDGYLILPINLINRFSLRRAGYRRAVLGDGNTVILALYRATVVWHGKEREVPVLQTGGGPLVGMALLEDNRVTLDVIKDGDVTIEILT